MFCRFSRTCTSLLPKHGVCAPCASIQSLTTPHSQANLLKASRYSPSPEKSLPAQVCPTTPPCSSSHTSPRPLSPITQKAAAIAQSATTLLDFSSSRRRSTLDASLAQPPPNGTVSPLIDPVDLVVKAAIPVMCLYNSQVQPLRVRVSRAFDTRGTGSRDRPYKVVQRVRSAECRRSERAG